MALTTSPVFSLMVRWFCPLASARTITPDPPTHRLPSWGSEARTGAVPREEAAATGTSKVLLPEESNPRRRPLASTATEPSVGWEARLETGLVCDVSGTLPAAWPLSASTRTREVPAAYHTESEEGAGGSCAPAPTDTKEMTSVNNRRVKRFRRRERRLTS